GPAREHERLAYKVVPDANPRLAMTRRREADIISKPPVEAIPQLEGEPELRVIKVDGVQLMTFELLTDKKPLDDVRVRRAIAHAIDRKAIIDGLLPGLASDYCAPVTPGGGRDLGAQQPC